MNLLKVLEQYLKGPAAARTGPSLLPSPEELDRGDPLAHKRAEFALPEGSTLTESIIGSAVALLVAIVVFFTFRPRRTR